MTSELGKYYISTFPGQNIIELHSRQPGKLEGPTLKTWYSLGNAYEIVRGYGREIREIMNDGSLTESEKKEKIFSLEKNLKKYLVVKRGE